MPTDPIFYILTGMVIFAIIFAAINIYRIIKLYKNEIAQLRHDIVSNPLNIENEQLRFEIQNLKRDNEELLKREKDVQKSITEALESNPMWGFPEHDAFPGSIAVASKLSTFSDDKTYGIVQGKLVLNDEANAEFLARKSNSTRLEYVLCYIKKLGFLDRIILQLLRSGCIQCTFGHNEETNSTEVYYQIQLLCPKDTVVYDLPSER